MHFTLSQGLPTTCDIPAQASLLSVKCMDPPGLRGGGFGGGGAHNTVLGIIGEQPRAALALAAILIVDADAFIVGFVARQIAVAAARRRRRSRGRARRGGPQLLTVHVVRRLFPITRAVDKQTLLLRAVPNALRLPLRRIRHIRVDVTAARRHRGNGRQTQQAIVEQFLAARLPLTARRALARRRVLLRIAHLKLLRLERVAAARRGRRRLELTLVAVVAILRPQPFAQSARVALGLARRAHLTLFIVRGSRHGGVGAATARRRGRRRGIGRRCRRCHLTVRGVIRGQPRTVLALAFAALHRLRAFVIRFVAVAVAA